MRIIALTPVAAETFSWRGPDPNVSLVVKAAFRLDRSGFVLDEDGLPLTHDVPSENDPELRYGSDFVPWKGRAEVVLVGHARAAHPSRCIPVRLALGEIDKRCFALAGAEVTSVPLSSTYLRATPQGGARVRVAPMPASAPGWADESLPRDVDYERFNGAANDQRLAAIEPGAELTLEGLIPGVPVFRTRLPTWRPTAFEIASPPGRAGDPLRLDDVSSWQPILLACDTLWIDVDRATAVIVWRGVFPAPRHATTIVVDAAERDLGPRDVVVRLARDHAPHDTDRPADTDRPQETERPPNLPEGTAELDWGEIAMKGVALPFAPSPGDEPAARPPRRDRNDTLEEATGVLDMSASGWALPFRDGEPGRAPPPPPSAPELPRRYRAAAALEEETGVFDFAAQGPALPFANRDDRPPPPSAPTQVRPLPSSEERTGVFDFATQAPASALPFASDEPGAPRDPRRTAPLAGGGAADGALPFGRNALPPHVAMALAAMGDHVARGATMEIEAAPATDLPFSPGAARPPGGLTPPTSQTGLGVLSNLRAPLPQMPPLTPPTSPLATKPAEPPAPTAPLAPSLPAIPMVVHGAIKAALLDGESLTEALAPHGIGERVWRLAERRLAIELARSSPEAADLARDLDRAIAAARRDRVVTASDDEELETYLTVRAEVEESDDPLRALDELGMSREDWEKMRRRWTRRALVDANLAQTIRERLVAARGSLRRVHPPAR